MSEFKFLADFQPLESKSNLITQLVIFTPLNYLALFGAAWVVGKGLSMGWGP